MRKLINLLLAPAALVMGHNLNDLFESELNGLTKIDDEKLDIMWTAFSTESEFDFIQKSQNADRRQIFENNIKQIVEHNSDETQTYKMGLNQHSDMTFDEVKQFYNLVGAEQECSATRQDFLFSAAEEVPQSWDWREHGGVSPVKFQGICGSCWTFSTVGCLESAHMIKYGSVQTYSEQQLLDCAGDFDNHGCHGGLPSHAYEYLNYFGGITTEEQYPYKYRANTCEVTKDMTVLEVGPAFNLTEGDEEQLRQAVYQQPVSVAYEVLPGFIAYHKGVYSSKHCRNGVKDINHAVLAVGYGTDENGVDYWIIKNSWTDLWGDKGFFKIERGVNMCGIAMCNSYPMSIREIDAKAFLQ